MLKQREDKLGRNASKRALCSCGNRVLSIIWRRKFALLLFLGVVILLAICIQYSITKQISDLRIRPEQPQQQQLEQTEFDYLRKEPLPLQMDNLEIAGASKPLLEVLGKGRSGPRTILDSYRPVNLYVPPKRIVHLDLKGAPPKLSYLKQFFGTIKKLGATGVLLEWEDMFPWEENLEVLSAKNRYSKEEVLEMIESAESYNLEVIPLIQTFGHLEFALKNEEFVHLRESPDSPQALCPSLNSSFDFIQDMIDQVMRLHRNAQFLHIGCDEVFNMGECVRCRKKMKVDLFLTHVVQVASYIRQKYSRVVPIIWDDMLRHLPLSSLQMYNIGEVVEPMVWVYAESIYRFVPQSVWETYSAVFPYIWTASAFKGAFGETYYIPNARRHFENNMNWLQLMSAENSKFKKGFRGIVLTGWQRYDHFAVLCETLPAAIPSLAINLLAVSNGYMNESLKDTLHKVLDCGIVNSVGPDRDRMFDLEIDPFLWDHFSRCLFTGSQFFRILNRLHAIQREINDFLRSTKKVKAWLTDYNIYRNFSSPLRIEELMVDESRLYHSLISLIPSVESALSSIFDKYTINEWVEQNIYPLCLQLESLEEAAAKLKTFKTWPRRPFPILNDLQRLGLPTNP